MRAPAAWSAASYVKASCSLRAKRDVSYAMRMRKAPGARVGDHSLEVRAPQRAGPRDEIAVPALRRAKTELGAGTQDRGARRLWSWRHPCTAMRLRAADEPKFRALRDIGGRRLAQDQGSRAQQLTLTGVADGARRNVRTPQGHR